MFSSPSLIASRLLFVGLLIEVAELLALRRAFEEGGLFSRVALRILTSGTNWRARLGATVGGARTIGAVAVGQGVAAMVVLAVGTAGRLGAAAALTCLGTNSYLRVRRQIGSSGAEQLTLIALTTFALVLIAGGGDAARRVGDVFIAAQVVLAYFASGISKLASPTWRRGQAMRGILSTEGYGVPAIARILVAHPRIDALLCWSVMAWEVAFPLILIAPWPVMIALLAAGVMFHASCAFLMGLNRFPWAFCGCYPAIWVTATSLQQATGLR